MTRSVAADFIPGAEQELTPGCDIPKFLREKREGSVPGGGYLEIYGVYVVVLSDLCCCLLVSNLRRSGLRLVGC